MPTSRVEAFSDGVLAIIITIMVLNLREPDGNNLAALWHSRVGLLSYLLSFTYVGIYWTNHHHMFQVTTRVTGGILWANLVLLFFLSLFPFTTNWVDVTRYHDRTPVVVYGLNLLAAGVAYWVLQSIIIRSQGPDSALRKAVGADLKGKASPLIYLVGCLVALLGGAGIWIAVGCYVLVAGLWAIPDRRIETAVGMHPAVSEAAEEQEE